MACSVFSLVVFLSFCIPLGGGVGIDCPCLCVLVLCLHASECLCLLVIGFCDVIRDLTSLVCACHFMVCLAIMRAYVRAFICLCACVLLRGCLSLVSIFIFRKCCRCWRPSTASCKPTLSCTRVSWPNRRSALGRRLHVCRYTAFI